jgi:hypothetical protein
VTALGPGPNPSGLCMCGCGERTVIAPYTRSGRGWIKGEPVRYVAGHQRRMSPTEYVVDPESGCWLWQRTVNERGYGVTYTEDEHGHRTQWRLAHRAYYERHVEPIPDGMHLDHLCRQPLCCNPAHLEVVTNAENVRRGRATRLTADDVRAIRASTESNVALAARYGVGDSHVSHIRLGRAWADLGCTVPDILKAGQS